MKFVLFSLLALLVLSVESVVVKVFGLEVTRLDATIALVVFLGVRGTTIEGALTSFSIGYLLDVFTGRPTGLYPFLAVLMFLGAKVASQVLDGRSRGGFTLFVAGAAFAHSLLALFFSWLTSRTSSWHAFSLAGLPAQVVYAAVFAAVFFNVFKRIEPGERVETGVLRT